MESLDPTAVHGLATPLIDRLGPLAPVATDAARGRRRLTRWREKGGLDDDRHWRSRLAAEGLTEEVMVSLLGETAASLTDRLPPADWIEDGAFGARSTPDDHVDVSAPEPDAPYFAAPVAGRLIFPTVERLREDLTVLVGDTERFDPTELVDGFTDDLLWQVHRMLGRTVALELHLARHRGELTAEHPDGRFAQFMTGMRDATRQRRLFAEYPVLTRQITVAVRQWHTVNLRLVRRIVSDASLLGRHFADGADPGAVESISTNAGDHHLKGQSVAIVRWASGLKLVYKPRSMRLDAAFADLVGWLNESGLAHPLRVAKSLDRGEYGWSEFLVAQPCVGQAAVRRFYHRQGALLALLGLLRANDMHAENLIAVGEHPVVIDLETLLQPRLPVGTDLSPAEHLVHEVAESSVLQVGLLPTPVWVTRDGRSVDLSGLGHRPGQQTSIPVPMLADFGTDAMRVKLGRVDMDMPDHRPVDKEASINLLDYADDLAAGYTDMHRLCRRRRTELLSDSGPLSRFEGAPVRVLLQSTVIYGTLLRTAFHPDVLRDALERDRHFDHLWRRITLIPDLAPAVAAERRDLWCNDIPYFGATADGDVLFDSDGAEVEGVPLTAGLDLARDGLLAWDDNHLRAQLSLIRSSLAAATMNTAARFEYPDYELAQSKTDEPSEAFIEAAIRIGDRLVTDAHTSGSSAQWLGLSSQMGRNWKPGPLTPDLFNGLTGVAVFLAQLGDATGDGSYIRLARRAVVTIRRQIDRDGGYVMHGMAGLPGIAHGFCRLADLLDDETLRDAADDLAARTLDVVDSDAEFDVVGGAAGTIAALRILDERRPDGPAAAVIRAAADHLVTSAAAQSPGVGWMPALIAEHSLASGPLSGFGHGTAGIAWALGEAHRLLGDDRYADVCLAAVDYERSLFDTAAGAWRDLREDDGAAVISAWCHGAVGIGLARLGLRDTVLAGDQRVDDEITAALNNARTIGYGGSHSLCHGDLGTVDFFLEAANHATGSHLRQETNRWGAAILDSIRTQGWQCGLPFGEAAPSLMVGLAGIGYGLLRLANPHRVPSILTLAPTTRQ